MDFIYSIDKLRGLSKEEEDKYAKKFYEFVESRETIKTLVWKSDEEYFLITTLTLLAPLHSLSIVAAHYELLLSLIGSLKVKKVSAHLVSSVKTKLLTTMQERALTRDEALDLFNENLNNIPMFDIYTATCTALEDLLKEKQVMLIKSNNSSSKYILSNKLFQELKSPPSTLQEALNELAPDVPWAEYLPALLSYYKS